MNVQIYYAAAAAMDKEDPGKFGCYVQVLFVRPFSAGGRIGSSKREQERGGDAWEKNKSGKTIRNRRCVP